MALFECFAGSIVEKKVPRDEILKSEKYLLSSSNNSNINGICLDEGNYFAKGWENQNDEQLLRNGEGKDLEGLIPLENLRLTEDENKGSPEKLCFCST